MCSYCGCEAETVMKALTDQHQGIEALTRQVAGALDSEDIAEAASATAKLGALFDRHGRAEEQGLLRQLLLAGEAVEEVERLLSEHEKFRAGLFDPTVVSRPDELRLLLRALLDHAELEETDLFPYAWQVLSGESWDLVEEATLGYSD
ncbi:MAG: hemerythrin domain-containing protein [Actinomycetota bacterium]|nr:hemerythrin domain-containing protein [Actinomycetota bacterium]